MQIFIITGQTATGKTALSVEIAEQYCAEIISADSRQIYRGLDFCSNKITEGEKNGIPHWGIDITDVGLRFTAYDFQCYAREKILEIFSRGKNVVIVGGTGLYIDATMFEHYTFGGKRASLPFDEWQIWQPLQDHQITWLGLVARADTLANRIRTRAKSHHAHILSEIAELMKTVSPDWLLSLGLEPRFAVQEIRGEISELEFVEQLTMESRQYAKRQLTWFQRNKNIVWFDVDELSHDSIHSEIKKANS